MKSITVKFVAELKSKRLRDETGKAINLVQADVAEDILERLEVALINEYDNSRKNSTTDGPY